MNPSTPNARSARGRIWILLFVLTALVVIAGTLLWWQARPVSRPALSTPPIPDSPYRLANPADPPPGGMRFRSEPLLTPFQFRPDPLRRKISAFELVVRPRSTGAISGTLYFDTRAITFNEFGDELIPTNQTAEAHRVRLEEVPRAQIEAESQRWDLGGRHKLSATKRLYRVVFDQGEHPGQFWFVHDASPAGEHFLWIAPKSRIAEKDAGRPLPTTPAHLHLAHELGLRLFGPQPEPDGPVAQPLRLAGYRAREGFGMQQATVEAGIIPTDPGRRPSETNLVATVTLDPNRHEMDVFGELTGMRTLIGYAPIDHDMSPVDLSDPTGQGRQVWRLKAAAGVKGGLWRWGGDGSPTADHHLDLVIAPSSNGRHRLLIWQEGRLRNVVQLQDTLARRRNQLADRLQGVVRSERDAVMALHTEDPEAEVTIEGDHVTSLSVTHLTPGGTVIRTIQALPALGGITLHRGTITGGVAAALTGLQTLKALTCYSCSFDESAFASVGRLSSLESLHIRQADRLTDAAAEHIGRLTNLSTLVINREFHPRPDDWRDRVLSEQGIARIASLTKLTHLDLHGQNTTDENCRQLAALTNLTWLALSGEKLTDAGLAALKPLTNLTFLHLWDVAITRPAAEAFRRPGLNFEPGPFGREHD